jgi:hypothetical protein
LPVQIVPGSITMRREALHGRIDAINLILAQDVAQSFGEIYTQLEMLTGPARQSDGRNLVLTMFCLSLENIMDA